VFVLTDDLSKNLVTPQFMPNLAALEAQGSAFDNYFVTDSLCCPSRSSIFTGRYPHDTGVYTNGGTDGGYQTFDANNDQSSTVATDLQADGYRTAMMGKYLNGYMPKDPIPPGWTEWDVAGNGYPEFNYDLNQNGTVVHYGGPNAGGQDNYLTDVLSGLGNSYISSSAAAADKKPFFLEIATFAPHTPYTVAPKYQDLYPGLTYPRTPAFDATNTAAPSWLATRPKLSPRAVTAIDADFRKRAQDVKSVDDMIGSLVSTLKQSGAWNNTYLVFSSDNGYHMGEHKLTPGKLTAFDTDIGVPLIVIGPHVGAGRSITPFGENIDLRPTFDAWAATKPSEGIDGRDMTPLLSATAAGAAPPDWPTGVLVEHHGPDINGTDPDYPPPGSGNPTTYEALRVKGAVYVEYVSGEREYYVLSTDPYELHNVYSSLPASTVAALHAELGRVENCRDSPACSDITTPTG
jgi:arylsulfatase A-like enzyme